MFVLKKLHRKAEYFYRNKFTKEEKSVMNEFYLDPTSAEKAISSRLVQKDSSKIKNNYHLPKKISFKDVLKNVVDKTEGPPKVRQAMVDKYKAYLENGTYEVKAEELAEKMIQKIRENKSREII